MFGTRVIDYECLLMEAIFKFLFRVLAMPSKRTGGRAQNSKVKTQNSVKL